MAEIDDFLLSLDEDKFAKFAKNLDRVDDTGRTSSRAKRMRDALMKKERTRALPKKGMKSGGKVKRMSCPVDGMAKRGKTKIRKKGR